MPVRPPARPLAAELAAQSSEPFGTYVPASIGPWMVRSARGEQVVISARNPDAKVALEVLLRLRTFFTRSFGFMNSWSQAIRQGLARS